MLATQILTVDEFLQLEDDQCMYELVRGALIRMPEPSDLHEAIVQFLNVEFTIEARRAKLNYSLRQRNALLIPEAIDLKSARRPDLAVIDKPIRWRESEIEQGMRTVPHLIVEVASSNWSNDLIEKQEIYEAMGVPEYWIVDYRGLIPAKYCDRGKGKKVIVLRLLNGEYQRTEFINDELIPCQTFPDLVLTVDQILSPA